MSTSGAYINAIQNPTACFSMKVNCFTELSQQKLVSYIKQKPGWYINKNNIRDSIFLNTYRLRFNFLHSCLQAHTPYEAITGS